MKRKLQKAAPWPEQKQRDFAERARSIVEAAESALPGGTGAEKKRWVRNQLDALFPLPPIAEEVSDFIIFLVVECVYVAVQRAKAGSTQTEPRLRKVTGGVVRRHAPKPGKVK